MSAIQKDALYEYAPWHVLFAMQYKIMQALQDYNLIYINPKKT